MPYINISITEVDLSRGVLTHANATATNVSDILFEDPWYLSVRHFQTASIPVVCIVGFIGNILAAGAFLSPELRKTSCCLHLATKSISDVGFLLSLFIIWLNRLNVSAFTTEGICQTTVFLTYVGGFLSVWFVVIITCENFIRVSLPGSVATMCNVSRAKCTILVVIMISVAIYSFSFWTTGVMTSGNKLKCISFEKYEILVMAMTYVDSIITLVIPLVAMVILNIAIAIGALRAHKRRKRLFQSMSRSSSKKRRDASSPEAKVSKLLFAVSVIFLLLHTPSHVIRIKMIFLQIVYHSPPSVSDIILHRIFELMYYMNFSVYCLVYLVFGGNFRAVFLTLYCPSCTSSPALQNNSFKTYSKRGSEAEAILE